MCVCVCVCVSKEWGPRMREGGEKIKKEAQKKKEKKKRRFDQDYCKVKKRKKNFTGRSRYITGGIEDENDKRRRLIAGRQRR